MKRSFKNGAKVVRRVDSHKGFASKMQKFRLNITSTVHNQILLLKIPFIRITRPQLLHIRSFATEIPEKTTNSGYTTKKDEFVNENLDSDTVQTSQSASTNVKTAEELKNEAEKARKRLEEMKDVEMLFQKFLLRGLRYVTHIHAINIL